MLHPLSKSCLKRIKSVLTLNAKSYDIPKASANAAVLIPLCNVDNRPGILFQIRGKALRAHSGEVAFPGGRVDLADRTHQDAALRETHEELGINPSQVSILGSPPGPPEINLHGDMVVWPFVGFIHAHHSSHLDYDTHSNCDLDDEHTPLPSVSLSDLRRTTNRMEVDAIFHLPFEELLSPRRLRSSMFRGNRPYWTVGVSDLVAQSDLTNAGPSNSHILQHLHIIETDVEPNRDGTVDPTSIQKETTHRVPITLDPGDDTELGPGKNGNLEIWGLTGWYLNSFMRSLGMYGAI
ncbi:hypothetical protein L218DRAFT_1080166 [Marasmius fiardii PR-910]|nr:hypothetical protein L218DRAFT_1080166 [Marasmius fiardii PR-910]